MKEQPNCVPMFRKKLKAARTCRKYMAPQWVTDIPCRLHTAFALSLKRGCPKSCGFCGGRIELEGMCKTTWEMDSAGKIKNTADDKCMTLQGISPTTVNPTTVADMLKVFLSTPMLLAPMPCWKVESGKTLTGTKVCEDNSKIVNGQNPQVKGPEWAKLGFCDYSVKSTRVFMHYNCKKTCGKCDVWGKAYMHSIDEAKESVIKWEFLTGFNVKAEGYFDLIRSGHTLKSERSVDQAVIQVACDSACSTGEKRCPDGECKASCPE